MVQNEQILLVQSSFSNPYCGDVYHDLACQYLATPQGMNQLISFLGIEHKPMSWQERWQNLKQQSLRSQVVIANHATLAYPITKGLGRFKSTLGVADMVLHVITEEQHTRVQQCERERFFPEENQEKWTEWMPRQDIVFNNRLTFGVEVKVTRPPLDELLRQIQLYRFYSGIKDWVVVTTYAFPDSEIYSLLREDIRHLRLEKKFYAFVKDQQQKEAIRNLQI